MSQTPSQTPNPQGKEPSRLVQMFRRAAQLLLTNDPHPESDILGPYECRVYCWNK